MTERVFNFSPGPAILPVPVLEQAQRDLVALPGVGMSVMELSHRSKTFEAILAEARSLLVELLKIPSGYSVLFLQGGASLQFAMIPMNYLRGSAKPADYIISGTWGGKALADAKREGAVNVAWDGKADKYARLPAKSELKLTDGAPYVHYTSNETIQGVQFQAAPEVGAAPLVCDASSDFLSRPVAIDKHALIFACAQKNAGISGVTTIILRDDLLPRGAEGLSPMLDYRVQAENQSLYNTPPTFAIYITMLIGRWLRDEIGGLDKMAALNRRKSKLLYDTLDSSGGFYRGHAEKPSRSDMNVTFRLPSEELENAFVAEAKQRKLVELKGHRSVGGIRASIYNAMPLAGVETLRDFMLEFQKKHG